MTTMIRSAVVLHARCCQVAEALTIASGEPWGCPPLADADAPYPQQRIDGPDHQALVIDPAPGNRLEIHGSFGTATAPSGVRPMITVSADRRPMDIARELLRRLLPAYRTSLIAARAAQAAADAREARRVALARSLRDLTGGQYYADRRHRVLFDGVSDHTDRTLSGEVEILSDEGMILRLTGVSAAQARVIVAVVCPQPAAPGQPRDQAKPAHDDRCYLLVKADCDADYLGFGAAFVGEPEGPARIVAVAEAHVRWQQQRLASGRQHVDWQIHASEEDARAAARAV